MAHLAVMLAIGVAAGGTAKMAEEPQTQPHTQTQHAGHEHSHDATVTHPFDDVDAWTDVFDDPNRLVWQKPDQIPGALGLKPGMAVADIGAGTGYFLKFFSDAVGTSGKVYAVDIEPKLTAYMQERARRENTANVTVVLGVPDDPKLPAAALDVIFICNTWHHINNRIDYLGLLAKALKPGGVVALVDFQKRETPVGPPLEHKMAREEVVAEFAEAGWVLAGESDILPYQYLLIFGVTPPAAR